MNETLTLWHLFHILTGVHRDGDSRNPVESAGFTWVWVIGYAYFRNTPGMDFAIAGFQQGWILLWREPCGNASNCLCNIMIWLLMHGQGETNKSVIYVFNFSLLLWSKIGVCLSSSQFKAEQQCPLMLHSGVLHMVILYLPPLIQWQKMCKTGARNGSNCLWEGWEGMDQNQCGVNGNGCNKWTGTDYRDVWGWD